MFTQQIDEVIALKLKEYQDSKKVFELIDASRDQLQQWMTWVDEVQSPDDVDKVTRRQLLQFVKKEAMHFVVLYNGEVAGDISLKEINWSIKSAEIGYWLGSAYTGKGIMTRAVRSILDYAFDELGLHKVEIWAAEENVKSRRIPERLGFVQEGTRRDDELIGGKYITMVIYGLLEDEWHRETDE
ncbi:ribosomal-protein-serine acetyltransferase [Alkalibacterium putridalgicola]|uniref:50S ribosomal protein L7 serine acetyltransferase n=1 Tax=Alkalibacterium putridalgicola TaxID=426703 RepID=A0A1H7TFG0_9LACT|nr:GNAT family protein [Alkalibacterium putridalgicola]GEK89447.1 50S ribosomal protein L7 serine acetyltransferase [Alkalibacterium putridalgicola]SEL83418.1 ribosomal-protein-serine acetyltransferase [Alkalibacterium putridalgicola]